MVGEQGGSDCSDDDSSSCWFVSLRLNFTFGELLFCLFPRCLPCHVGFDFLKGEVVKGQSLGASR